MNFNYIIKIENQEDLDIAKQLTNEEELKCFIISTEIEDNDFVKQVQDNESIILCDGENETLVEYYKKHSLDGVVINIQDSYKIKKDIKEIKEQIDKNAFIGARCHISRHESMLAGEADIDFALYSKYNEDKEKSLNMISWWNEFFTIQSAIEGEFEKSDINQLDEVNTDFIIINAKNYKNLG